MYFLHNIIHRYLTYIYGSTYIFSWRFFNHGNYTILGHIPEQQQQSETASKQQHRTEEAENKSLTCHIYYPVPSRSCSCLTIWSHPLTFTPSSASKTNCFYFLSWFDIGLVSFLVKNLYHHRHNQKT